MQIELTDEILTELSEGDDMPDFECPDCGGAFFHAWEGEYECTTDQMPRCKWKGSASECLVPSRAVLAAEILRLRAPLRELLVICDEQDERGEPMIGHDHTGAVDYLLEFSDKIRSLVKR